MERFFSEQSLANDYNIITVTRGATKFYVREAGKVFLFTVNSMALLDNVKGYYCSGVDVTGQEPGAKLAPEPEPKPAPEVEPVAAPEPPAVTPENPPAETPVEAQ